MLGQTTNRVLSLLFLLPFSRNYLVKLISEFGGQGLPHNQLLYLITSVSKRVLHEVQICLLGCSAV
jgi:hypothetical protein